MKNLFKLAGCLALATALFACNREVDVNLPANGEKHWVKITAAPDAATRTTFVEADRKSVWSDEDLENIHLYENGVAPAKSDFSAVIVDGNLQMTAAFSGTAPFTYTSILAHEMVGSEAYVPENQELRVGTYDPNADILVAKPQEYTETQNEFMFQYARVVAVNKMTIKDLTPGDKLEEVTISSDVPLLGSYDMTTNEWTDGSYQLVLTAKEAIEIPSSGSVAVYFITAPVEGAQLTVKVDTEDNMYEKGFSKPISFPQNTFTTFATSMLGMEGGEYFVKIKSGDNTDDWSGKYLIVYEEGSLAFNSFLNSLDVAQNTIEIEIGEEGIIADAETRSDQFVIAPMEGGWSIKTHNGTYIGQTGDNNGLAVSDEPILNVISAEDGVASIVSSSAHLMYNATSGQERFRYYKSSSYTNQEPIALYRLGGGLPASKPSAGLSFEETSYEITFGDSFTAPTLTNPHSVPVTYASDNTDVATVTSTGAVTIVAVGTAKITASFAGNETYKAGSASYTITVNPAQVSLTLPFDESFTESGGTMGWSGSVANGAIAYDNEGWEAENAYGAGGSARFGKASSGLGKATTPEIYYSGNATLTFKAGAWNISSESTNLKLSVSSGAIYQDVAFSTSAESVKLVKGEWTEYTLYLKDIENSFTVTFEGNAASNSRFFLDDISIVEGIIEPAPVFGASMPNSENVSSAGGTKVINVTGNVSWTVSSTSGITVSPSSGSGAGTVTVTIPENTNTENTVSHIVTVSTQAQVSPNNYEFTITQNAAPSVVNTSTETDPYTPAEVVALAEKLDDNGTLADVYVSGIISQITTEYNDSFKNVSFTISSDGLTSGTQFLLFRVPATSADDYQVGDAVEFKGTLMNYNGNTPELTATFEKVYQYKAPSFSVDAGEYSSAQSVSLSADQGAVIYYTIDGSVPTVSSPQYSNAINVSTTMTIKAFAVKSGVSTGVVSATYTISASAYALYKTFTATGIGSGYGVHTGVKSDNLEWTVTFGQSTYIGTNSSNKGNCKLGDPYAKVGTPCNYEAATTQVSAVISESKLDRIAKVEVSGDTDSHNPEKISLVYSTDNITYSLVETQDYSQTNGNVFLFDSKSEGYYAIVLYSSGSDYMRTNGLKIKFFQVR